MQRARSMALPSVELRVLEGPDRGARLELVPGFARIGTALNAQLRLTDPSVSRMHCEIHVRAPGAETGWDVRVTDTGSTNGTFVDGVRVFDAELGAGATLRVGGTSIRVEIGDEPIHVQVSERESIGALIGRSLEMRRVFALIERVANSDSTVLVTGETGTGKELAARAIHDSSKRQAGPFVTVDCGAIAENLIESELFGHVRGAFTGAAADRRGLLEEAHGGTLYLDEIGELPLALQPKLLRALETRTVRRVGANVPRSIDVRVIAATNRPLARQVNEGAFREDLYYRVAVVELSLPPLRARREDIALLAGHFYRRFAERDEPLPNDLVATLHARAWPGNVRELRNFVERSVSLGWARATAEPQVEAPPTPPGLEALVPVDRGLREAREVWTERFERLYVGAILRKTGGNVTRAAELAGITRRSLQRLLAQLGVKSADIGNEGEG